MLGVLWGLTHVCVVRHMGVLGILWTATAFYTCKQKSVTFIRFARINSSLGRRLIQLRPFGIRDAIETVVRPFKTALYRAPGDCFPASRPNPITSLPCALRCGETGMKAAFEVRRKQVEVLFGRRRTLESPRHLSCLLIACFL